MKRQEGQQIQELAKGDSPLTTRYATKEGIAYYCICAARQTRRCNTSSVRSFAIRCSSSGWVSGSPFKKRSAKVRVSLTVYIAVGPSVGRRDQLGHLHFLRGQVAVGHNTVHVELIVKWETTRKCFQEGLLARLRFTQDQRHRPGANGPTHVVQDYAGVSIFAIPGITPSRALYLKVLKTLSWGSPA
eukprot:g12528.t1